MKNTNKPTKRKISKKTLIENNLTTPEGRRKHFQETKRKFIEFQLMMLDESIHSN